MAVEPVVDTKYAAKGSEAESEFTMDAGSLSGDELAVWPAVSGRRHGLSQPGRGRSGSRTGVSPKSSFVSKYSEYAPYAQSTFAIASSSDPLMVWDVS